MFSVLKHKGLFMIKDDENLKLTIVAAVRNDLATIQKMWPFYVYDLARECELTKEGAWPTDASYVPDDVRPYFEDSNKKAFLIKINNELAGFALINKLEIMPEIDYFLNDFFIFGKFQNKGIGKLAAIELFSQCEGKWALGVIPTNKKALAFWREMLTSYTANNFSEISKTSKELKTAECSDPHPMIIFTFDSKNTSRKG
jgi:predicted acetyltransferase